MRSPRPLNASVRRTERVHDGGLRESATVWLMEGTVAMVAHDILQAGSGLRPNSQGQALTSFTLLFRSEGGGHPNLKREGSQEIEWGGAMNITPVPPLEKGNRGGVEHHASADRRLALLARPPLSAGARQSSLNPGAAK